LPMVDWLIHLDSRLWIFNDIMLLLGSVISEHGYQIYIQIMFGRLIFEFCESNLIMNLEIQHYQY
jgi:hypothetical protein